MWLRKITLILRNECGSCMVTHCSGMHKVAWRHFRHAVYTRIHVYASGHEKVSSGNLGSGTLADKTPAHWPRPTENWWSDPQSELLDWQNPETGPKLSADPQSTVFFKSANPLDLSPKSTIRELFKAKSADPRTYSPRSFRMTGDVTCLKTCKNIKPWKTMYCSETWINFYIVIYIDFQTWLALVSYRKLVPHLAEIRLYFYLRGLIDSRPARRIEKSPIQCSTCVPELRLLRNQMCIND